MFADADFVVVAHLYLCCRPGAGINDLWSYPNRGRDGNAQADGRLCWQHHLRTLPVSQPAGQLVAGLQLRVTWAFLCCCCLFNFLSK